jgi:hypothetical protein
MADERLGGRVAGPGALPEEGRQRDRGEDAHDQDHDQQLDEREPVLIAVHHSSSAPSRTRLNGR